MSAPFYPAKRWPCVPLEKVRARFFPKVDERGPDECWPWIRSRGDDGYGRIAIGGKVYRAPRIAWELANNEAVGADRVVRHTCDNPICVNPTHLCIGTQGDNVRDAVARNRLWMQSVTHCPRGHAYDEANTHYYKNRRFCRECNRLATAKRDGRPVTTLLGCEYVGRPTFGSLALYLLCLEQKQGPEAAQRHLDAANHIRSCFGQPPINLAAQFTTADPLSMATLCPNALAALEAQEGFEPLTEVEHGLSPDNGNPRVAA